MVPFDLTIHLRNAAQLFNTIVWKSLRSVYVEPMLEILCMKFRPGSLTIQEDTESKYVLFRGAQYLAGLEEWVGERRNRGEAHSAEWIIREKRYEVNELLEWDDSVSSPFGPIGGEPESLQRDNLMLEILHQFNRAWQLDPVDFVHKSIDRNGDPCYDGEALISHTHKQLSNEPFSNALLLGDDIPLRNDPFKPTFDEAYEELHRSSRKLLMNQLHRNRVQLVPTNEQLRYLAIVRSEALFDVFSEINETERLKVGEGNDRTDMKNPFFGKLLLAINRGVPRDHEYAKSFDLVAVNPKDLEEKPAGPNAIRLEPRPMTIGITKDVGGVKFDDTKLFDYGKLRIGIDGRLAIGPGYPQQIVRVYHNELSFDWEATNA